MTYYLKMWKNGLDFEGRATRAEFWWPQLFDFIFTMALNFTVVFTVYDSSITYGYYYKYWVLLAEHQPVAFWIFLIYALAVAIPSFSLQFRRLHDTGTSGWYLLLGLVPYVGRIILFVLYLIDGNKGPNQYGPNPKLNMKAKAF